MVCVVGVDVKWSDKMNTDIFIVLESNIRLDKTCLGQNPQRLFIYRSRFTTSTPLVYRQNLNSVAEVPNTQTVRCCHDCRGLRETRCTRCHGRGFVSVWLLKPWICVLLLRP